jgi:hypothetical protein
VPPCPLSPAACTCTCCVASLIVLPAILSLGSQRNTDCCPLCAPSACRPDKNTLDQQLGKNDFVELRRAELERYLRKLAAHPVVGPAEVRRRGFGSPAGCRAQPVVCLSLQHPYIHCCYCYWSVTAVQELRVFLEAEGSLAGNFHWQQLQPMQGTLLEGISRLPRQLIGAAGAAGRLAAAASHRKRLPLSTCCNGCSAHPPTEAALAPVTCCVCRSCPTLPRPPCRLRQQRAQHCGGPAECSQHQRPAAPLPRAGGAHAPGVQGPTRAQRGGGAAEGEA